MARILNWCLCFAYVFNVVICMEYVFLSRQFLSDTYLATFRQLSLNDCITRCKERTACRHVNYRTRARVCYLIPQVLTTWSVPGNAVVSSSKADWDMTGYSGCVSCKYGQRCLADSSTCVTTGCGAAPILVNATSTGNRNYIGASVRYMCNNNARVVYKSQCQSSGEWSDISSDCPNIPPNTATIQVPPTTAAYNPNNQPHFSTTAAINPTTLPPTTAAISTNPPPTTTAANSTNPPPTTTAANSTNSPTTTAAISTNPPPSTTAANSTNPPPTTTAATSTNPPPTTTAAISTNPPQTTTAAISTNPPPPTTAAITTNPPPPTTAAITTNPPPTTTAAISTNPPQTTTAANSTNPPPTTTAAISTNPPPTTTAASTLPLWFFCDQSLYMFNITEVTWMEAQDSCDRASSHLADFKNLNPITCIESNYYSRHSGRRDFWIGANDLAQEGTFRWSDGTVMTSPTNWSPTEPNDLDGIEDCVSFFTKDFLWNDADCSSVRAFLCEI